MKKAHDYYEQEDFKDDAAKAGQELHAQMMPLFEQTFAAEAELRRDLDVDQARTRQASARARSRKPTARKYQWHLRSYLLAAKELINLLPGKCRGAADRCRDYKPRYAELEEAYNAFQTFSTEHPDEMKKIMLASFVESAVKDFFTASKFLRRTLEAPKLDRREYFERVGELAQQVQRSHPAHEHDS